MRRVIIREYDQLAEALSNLNAMFAFRIMNLCVKAEEASLLPVKVMVEGEMQNLEKCASINKKDDFTFVIIPQFDEDIQMIASLFRVNLPADMAALDAVPHSCHNG